MISSWDGVEKASEGDDCFALLFDIEMARQEFLSVPLSGIF